MQHLKEVYFNEHCAKCKYEKVKETDDPCNECLSVPAMENTHKPDKFEEAN